MAELGSTAARHSIGLMGGTFNPIHHGHLRMAQELAAALNLDEIRFITAGNPPHKAGPQVSAEHRAAMVSLAIDNNPLFTLDARETKRSGASYTIDTLTSLRQELGTEVSLVLLMGSDAFTKFDTWHRWQEIIGLCHIALVQRPQQADHILPKALETFLHNHYTENADELHEAAAGWVTMQQITALDISSTAIRLALARKESARYLMPDQVLDYILRHQLYV